MKLKFTAAKNQKLEVQRRISEAGLPLSNLQPSTFTLQPSQRGVALVITLILLSVTLVMAVAFLALSRRDRSSVGTTTDTAAARLATESALAYAQAQIVANALAFNGFTNVGLIVSTNYINGYGFQPGSASPTNVNFDYTFNNAPFNINEIEQDVANLQILPRVPVYQTNYVRNLIENSFYLDLNQNGVFDTNNWASGTNAYGVGDPEWIGVLERPDAVHSPNNLFTSRYAFIAVPADSTLDLNYIHNQTRNRSLDINLDGYFRNQSVGTWEINLAAFLADLNTNEWDANPAAPTVYYQYNQPDNPNRGRSFNDAFELLTNRYDGVYTSLDSANQILANANVVFRNNGIDNYSDGPQQTNFNTNIDFAFPDDPTLPWAGADNTNHYFDLSVDLFGASRAPSFSADLANVGAAYSLANTDPTNFYNRYTYYRMLEQLGTDSQPDQGKINLNYSNAAVTYNNRIGIPTSVGITPGAETNLVSWRPIDFFTAAADLMLRTYSSNWFRGDYLDYSVIISGGITNIIYHSPSNYLATYYNIRTNYFSYTDAQGLKIWNDPSGYGLNLNIDAYLTASNQIPAFGIMHIPVWVSNRFVYSPAVNRVLQLAANLYDSSKTNFYPSVFRPVFTNDGSGIFICGYHQIQFATRPASSDYGTAWQNQLPLSQAIDPSFLLANTVRGVYSNNLYGVPWIIGTKKNLPGLNQFSMVNSAQFTRRLQISRAAFGGPILTNQLNTIGITNSVGISFWNPYNNDYPTNYPGLLDLTIYVSHSVQLVLTNSAWGTTVSSQLFTRNFFVPFPQPQWPGSHWAPSGEPIGLPAADSFMGATWANVVVPDLVYKINAAKFAQSNDPDLWESGVAALNPLPQFGLLTTNWLQAVIIDNTNVIDYVQLRGPIDATNLTTALADPNYADATLARYLWSLNVNSAGSPSWGIINQIDISSKADSPPPSAVWNNPPSVSIPGITDPITAQRVFFNAILQPRSFYQYQYSPLPALFYTNYQLVVQAPYTAERTIFSPYLYQVNDPLVHYLASDLDAGLAARWAGGVVLPNGSWAQDNGLIAATIPIPPSYQDTLKSRYQPWAKAAPGTFQTSAYNFGNADNLMYKDPLVLGGDYWDFPTNRYPSVGWIGRVHRGTPWQTVYLKAENVVRSIPVGGSIAAGTNTWAAWTGDYNYFDAVNSGPLQDRLLFDMFTSTPNENASHGKLSVNQSQLASWSALLSGAVAITNTTANARMISLLVPRTYDFNVIPPAGVNGLDSALGNIVTNINSQRATFTNADGMIGSFEHAGDVLSTMQFTEHSPFLNWNDGNQQLYGLTDEAYEWLPQQAMSLLTCSTAPRYVVYCYGQTLKPAPNSLVTASGSFFGLCTNYQVVAESAVRAVVQLHPVLVPSPNGGFMTNYTTTVESFTPLPAY